MSISANFPNVRPSLLLDFAQSQQLDPRVTFSRSTTAPYYDGKTSVLAEQNLLLQSQTFSTSPWVNEGGNTVTLNSTTAPDGNATGTTILWGTAGKQYQPSSQPTLSANQFTASCYFKPNTDTSVTLTLVKDNAALGSACTFNLSAGTTGAITNYGSTTGSTVAITSAGNGWYRCSITVTATSTSTWYVNIIGITTGNSIYAWGAQLEQRSSATAYNATTTTALTNYIPQLLTAPINQPRFDFNPTTGESLGLLIEQSSTNLLTYSQDFSNGAWTKSNATITTGANIAPDGTQTMQLLVENTTTAQHYLRADAFTLISGTQYTTTIYAKANGRTTLGICCAFDSNGANFNLSNGTVGTVSGGATATITPVGNGVYRCSMTRTPTSNTVIVFQLNGNASSYTGDGYSGIYIWGAQLEALAFPTSYIPTTSAQVTRASDIPPYILTSGWYNIAQGTIYAESTPLLVSAASPLYALSDNSGTNFNTIYGNQFTGNHLVVRIGNVTIVNLSAGTYINNTSTKYASFYGVNNFAVDLNGGSVTTSTNGNLPTVDRLFIGGNSSGTTSGVQRIKKLAYYPQVLNSTQLQALTGS